MKIGIPREKMMSEPSKWHVPIDAANEIDSKKGFGFFLFLALTFLISYLFFSTAHF